MIMFKINFVMSIKAKIIVKYAQNKHKVSLVHFPHYNLSYNVII